MTMTATRQSNDEEWEQLTSMQPQVAPKSFLQEGEILSRDTEEQPGAMRVNSLKYKGYVEVWNTRTGDKSLQPQWLLWQTARKHFPDGRKERVFTRTNPHIAPDYGENLTCPLSPDAPANEALTGMGFRLCNEGRGKHHIPHRAALEKHIRKSHKQAYEAIEKRNADRLREEDREIQREAIRTNQQLMQALLLGAVSGQQAPAKATKTVTKACDRCDFVAEGPNGMVAANRLRAHQKTHD